MVKNSRTSGIRNNLQRDSLVVYSYPFVSLWNSSGFCRTNVCWSDCARPREQPDTRDLGCCRFGVTRWTDAPSSLHELESVQEQVRGHPTGIKRDPPVQVGHSSPLLTRAATPQVLESVLMIDDSLTWGDHCCCIHPSSLPSSSAVVVVLAAAGRRLPSSSLLLNGCRRRRCRTAAVALNDGSRSLTTAANWIVSLD